MVAQANKTSKNTTNEIEKMTTVPPYTYKLLNSQNQLEIGLLNHLAQQVRMIFISNIEFFSTFLKKYTGQVKREIWLARCNNIDIACPEQLHKEPIHGKI